MLTLDAFLAEIGYYQQLGICLVGISRQAELMPLSPSESPPLCLGVQLGGALQLSLSLLCKWEYLCHFWKDCFEPIVTACLMDAGRGQAELTDIQEHLPEPSRHHPQ